MDRRERHLRWFDSYHTGYALRHRKQYKVIHCHSDGQITGRRDTFLDDHLYQWLPSFQYVDSTTTIRQLLTHQSGIWDYWNDSPSIFDSIWADTSRFWTTEEIIGSIRAPHFAPGNGYRYSNTNYVLAGMIIEAATGQTWVQKLHDFIFDPVELDSTFVGAFEPRNGPVAAEWDAYFGHLITNSPMTAEYSQANACGGNTGNGLRDGAMVQRLIKRFHYFGFLTADGAHI